MNGDVIDLKPVNAHLPLSYDDWLAVLDALEPEATTKQRDIAQDTIQRSAPRGWIKAVEARDSR